MTKDVEPSEHMRHASLFWIASVCPLIAASDTIVSAVSAGIVTMLVGCICASLVVLLSRWLDDDTRLLTILLVSASLVAIVELAMRAWFHVARETLGIFLPQIGRAHV